MARITIGGVGYDSYASLAEADKYLAADFSATAWHDEADEDIRGRALVTASRLLDRQPWVGAKEDEDQTTAWPRTGVDGVEDGDIPPQLVEATIVLASLILEGADTATNPTTQSNIKSQRAGSVAQEFFRPDPKQAGRLPLPVQELLAGLMGSSATGIAATLSYGVDGCSTADDSYTPAGGF